MSPCKRNRFPRLIIMRNRFDYWRKNSVACRGTERETHYRMFVANDTRVFDDGWKGEEETVARSAETSQALFPSSAPLGTFVNWLKLKPIRLDLKLNFIEISDFLIAFQWRFAWLLCHATTLMFTTKSWIRKVKDYERIEAFFMRQWNGFNIDKISFSTVFIAPDR